MALTSVQRHALVAEYNQLLPEVESRRLNTPPVWLASVDKKPLDELTSRSHSFVIVGNPGRGQRSGAAYYSISGDEKRGGVDVDAMFVEHVNTLKSNDGSKLFDDHVRATVARLQNKSYASKEAFYLDYRKARTESAPDIKPGKIAEEVSRLTMLVSPDKMEMWLREPNGRSHPKPNLAERDLRTFENLKGVEEFSGKDMRHLSDLEMHSGNALQFRNVSIRRQTAVDPLALLEAKRSCYLQRLYIDELHGRNGTGIPTQEPKQRPVSRERLQQVTSLTPTYHNSPPLIEGKQGNCTTGTATLMRAANTKEADIKPASPYAFGLHHRIRTWVPVKERTPQESQSSQNPDIDTRPLRNTDFNAANLNAMLRKRAAHVNSPGDIKSVSIKAKL